MGKLPPNDQRAPYLQVADALLQAVAAGQYAPGEQLPALAAIAAEFDVAVGTVRRALRLLAEQGITTTRQGTGSFIREDLDLAVLSAPTQVGRGVEAQLAVIAAKLDEFGERLTKLDDRMADVVRTLHDVSTRRVS